MIALLKFLLQDVEFKVLIRSYYCIWSMSNCIHETRWIWNCLGDCFAFNLSPFYRTKIDSSTTAEHILYQVAPSHNNPCEAPKLKSDIWKNVQDDWWTCMSWKCTQSWGKLSYDLRYTSKEGNGALKKFTLNQRCSYFQWSTWVFSKLYCFGSSTPSFPFISLAISSKTASFLRQAKQVYAIL